MAMRPLGFKGSNPYKAHSTLCVSLANLPPLPHSVTSVGRQAPPRSSFVIVVERAGTKDYNSNV